MADEEEQVDQVEVNRTLVWSRSGINPHTRKRKKKTLSILKTS